MIVKTKVTIQPETYGTDSSLTEAPYKLKKFEEAFPDPPKVPKSVGGLKIKKSVSENKAGTSSQSVIPQQKAESSRGGNEVKESVSGPCNNGENPSSELFDSSPELSVSDDVTLPLSGFITTQSNSIVHIFFYVSKSLRI